MEIARYRQQIWIAVGIFVVEVGGGLLSGSFAVIADSTHAILDFAFYLVGAKVARIELGALANRPEARRVGAFAHSFLFFAFAVVVAVEAINRVQRTVVLQAPLMAAAAMAGLLGNCAQAAISRRSRANVTERAVNVHNVIDVLASVIAVGAGVLALAGVASTVDAWAALLIAFVLAGAGALLIREAKNGETHSP